MERGRFITFEGGEGVGKSTQIRRLASRLSASGYAVCATREPGGSEGAEQIRALLVDGRPDRWSATTEALLVNAARRDHLERVILPALARGEWVICDRFMDSTRAYQGAAGGASPDLISILEAEVVGSARPNLTLLLDLPAAEGLARAGSRGDAARFESKGTAFHERLRSGFLAIASSDPLRVAVIDASGDEASVADRVWTEVVNRLGTGRS